MESQNGYPVLDSLEDCKYYVINTANAVKVPLSERDAGWVLAFFLRLFDDKVETLDRSDTHGYNRRRITGSEEWSNHASGTAADANATKHVQGRTGTFTESQVEEIRKQLEKFDNVIKWGADYRVLKDEMHFEIVGTPDEVNLVARRLKKYNKVMLKHLDPGDRNIEVYMVKRALRNRGYEVGTYNLYFSVALTKALSKFQSDKGWEATGKADKRTLERLGFTVVE